MEMKQKPGRLRHYPTFFLALCMILFACNKDPNEEETPAASTSILTNKLSEKPDTNNENNATTHETYSINTTSHFYCGSKGIDEDVRLTGTYRIVRHRVVNGPSSHSLITGTVHLTGVGLTTGNRYVGNGTFTSVNNFNTQTAVTINLEMRRFGSKGDAEVIQSTAHGVMTPDGNLHADWESTTIECR
jgi:hypothetical protein